MENQNMHPVALHNQPSMSPLRTSPEIGALAEALSKAQAVMKHPGRTKTAKVPTKTGGSYSYNYADLADVIDAVRGPFAENGLSIIQSAFSREMMVGVVTRIMHSSGQWIEGTLSMPCGDTKPQTIGSAITYGRRYSLAPLAGIASDDDDDASLAQGVTAEITPRARQGSPMRSGTVAQPSGTKPSAPENEHMARVKKMLVEFEKLNVTGQQLQMAIGKRVEDFDDNDMVILKQAYRDLKDGKITSEDIGFAASEPTPSEPTNKEKLDKAFKGTNKKT